MDIVYILGTGSVWRDNELRYSLRGVDSHILDKGKVFIVGEKPVFLQNINHIPCSDPYGAKWKNAYTKILKACNTEEISDDFLLMNDDFFILKDIKAKEYPYYFSKVLPRTNSIVKARFETSSNLTFSFLKNKTKNYKNFAVHRPIVLNKKKYLEMPKLDITMVSFSPRSFYCNFYNVPGVLEPDKNIPPSFNLKTFTEILNARTDISIFSRTAQNKDFQKWLQDQFPHPSQYEAS